MLAVVDQRMSPRMQWKLSALGFSVIPLPSFSLLSHPVASHPDMLIFPFENVLFVHNEYYQEASTILEKIAERSGYRLSVVKETVSAKYPNDVSLNLFCLGKNLFGRADKIPRSICDYAKGKDYQIVNTNQGYAKCSTVVVGTNAIITADASIKDAAEKTGADVQIISEGHVTLSPYPYGFLGGASGYCKNTVYFCGNITLHPDAKSIATFCRKYDCEIICLSEESLADMGSIFFL